MLPQDRQDALAQQRSLIARAQQTRADLIDDFGLVFQ